KSALSQRRLRVKGGTEEILESQGEPALSCFDRHCYFFFGSRDAPIVVMALPRSRGQPWAGLLTYAPCHSGKTTPLAVSGLLQYSAQSCINCRRFSNRSPRRYAASTPLAMACASACSTTWFG